MNSRTRFSNRVEDYLRHRPRYPQRVVERLLKEHVLLPDSVVADIGSGTGFSSELFLRCGCTVYGIEPNEEMRSAGEEFLAAYPGFISINGTAERTNLGAASVDLVVAGQAFHWFDRTACGIEWRRILKPGGHVVLLWNDRRIEGDAFSKAYEQLLLTHGTDYLEVRKKNVGTNVDRAEWDAFFGNARWTKFTEPNIQELDVTGLAGRLLSSSYVPAMGEPGNAEMMSALHDLFRRHQRNGSVELVYDTVVFCGTLGEGIEP